MVQGQTGFEGYGAELIARYESVDFAQLNRHFLPLIDSRSGWALDIGAGSGRDAAALSQRGFTVYAVEPVAGLRRAAMKIHSRAGVRWLGGSLPLLSGLDSKQHSFDVVLLQAVWFHLDLAQRTCGMRRIVELMAPGGLLCMTLRHGPPPPGRRVFDVDPSSTIQLAAESGLHCVLDMRGQPSLLSGDAVTWSRLAFRNDSPPAGGSEV